jgi:hypothetical protein
MLIITVTEEDGVLDIFSETVPFFGKIESSTDVYQLCLILVVF